MNEDRYRLLYAQDELPIFQNRMYDSQAQAQACPTGDLRLVQDLHTGLVLNHAFEPELMAYDAQYQNEQGVSPHFRAHLEAVARIVIERLGSSALIEVGCGKAFFLEMLLARGVDITGFDPTYEGSNPRVRRHYFEPTSGLRAKGLVLRHVLEHVQDPLSFLMSLRTANQGQGLIYIEVPCLDWICDHRAWFDVFYEHVNYFRIADFKRMFGTVLESGHLFGGQYLYVVAELASLRQPCLSAGDAITFPTDFTRSLATNAGTDHAHCTVWGGASKGVIFSLLRSRQGRPVDTVIDINPAKQGKYLPSTGLLVQSPERALPALPPGSTIYVMNSNYLEEIKTMSKHAYTCIGIDHE